MQIFKVINKVHLLPKSLVQVNQAGHGRQPAEGAMLGPVSKNDVRGDAEGGNVGELLAVPGQLQPLHCKPIAHHLDASNREFLQAMPRLRPVKQTTTCMLATLPLTWWCRNSRGLLKAELTCHKWLEVRSGSWESWRPMPWNMPTKKLLDGVCVATTLPVAAPCSRQTAVSTTTADGRRCQMDSAASAWTSNTNTAVDGPTVPLFAISRLHAIQGSCQGMLCLADV